MKETPQAQAQPTVGPSCTLAFYLESEASSPQVLSVSPK